MDGASLIEDINLIEAQADTIKRLEAENTNLRKALRPFAKASELVMPMDISVNWWVYRPAGGDEYGITVADLLKAGAALRGRNNG